jgi:LuxR family transcriptional activator of conjugal transfer of Ti plasmids
MTLVLERFVERLDGVTNGHDLRYAMTQFADGLGLTRFTYVDLRRPSPHPHLPVYLTTYPAQWKAHYERQRYGDIDPVIAMAQTSLFPFFWDDGILGAGASREQRKLFVEASDFAIRCGFTVPIYHSYGRAFISFTADCKSKEMKRGIEAHRNVLHLASIYFHVHAQRKLGDVVALRRPDLGLREIECLQWVLRGKTMWDVGEIMSISRRTVVFHLENAKRKLNAVSLPQAVAIALYHDLIQL